MFKHKKKENNSKQKQLRKEQNFIKETRKNRMH